MKVKFKLLENGVIPVKQTSGSAGYDLYSSEDIVVPCMESCLIKLGFMMEIEDGFEAQIRSRSGISFKNNVFVLNSPGTIDSDYRNEVGVLLFNLGRADFFVKKGDRIAQMIFSKVYSPEIDVIDNLCESSRSGGWGSTGK